MLPILRKEEEVAGRAVLNEKVAQLKAANAAGPSSPVKQDQAAAVRADAERKQEIWDANEARAAAEFTAVALVDPETTYQMSVYGKESV